jgi:ABC-2 type transport system ATP-binding protein
LVLDEPVSGLDPAERQKILQLVTDLAAGDTTVVLSSHVLAEIEPVCKRVIIVHRGRIVANDTIDALAEVGRRVTVRVARPVAGLVARLQAIDGVIQVDAPAEGVFAVIGSRDIREDVAAGAVSAGLLELKASQGLQEVFLRLTGES